MRGNRFVFSTRTDVLVLGYNVLLEVQLVPMLLSIFFFFFFRLSFSLIDTVVLASCLVPERSKYYDAIRK